jgi:hypothetical protein
VKPSFHTLNLCILLSGKFKIEHFEDKHACLKCNGIHPSVLCNTFKNSHVNRSVRAVQDSNLCNRTSSLRQPMAANVNQKRPNIQQTRFSFRPPVGVLNCLFQLVV